MVKKPKIQSRQQPKKRKCEIIRKDNAYKAKKKKMWENMGKKMKMSKCAMNGECGAYNISKTKRMWNSKNKT